ncbi:small multi-drug export protein [Halalkalibacillus halophilus]|uniref:small multi-drug export protein n=1 Tax=Halalkalibacillus halophilus TaxID=392827 RepID=UPI0004159D0B|nr:small multi-drug export protein [Halalkalibacillus halophilus]
MFEYIYLTAIAWFLGFFPLTEIYIAIPTSMIMGLDSVSAVIWASIGNFLPIPLIVYFYDSLMKWEPLGVWMRKLSNNRYREKIEQNGFIMILLLTPIIGGWAVGVIGRAIGLTKYKLFLSSAVSIFFYGIIIAFLTSYGIDFFR